MIYYNVIQYTIVYISHNVLDYNTMYIYIYIYRERERCIYIYIHIHTHTCIWCIYIYIYIYIEIYIIYIYIPIQIYIYIYIITCDLLQGLVVPQGAAVAEPVLGQGAGHLERIYTRDL